MKVIVRTVDDNHKPFLERYNLGDIIENKCSLGTYYYVELEINTLEELLELSDKCKNSLIFDRNFNDEPTITIYDNYIE